MLALALLGLCACAPGVDPFATRPPPDAADRARFVRQRVQDALALRSEARLESAERTLRRALAVDPGAAHAHRLLAIVLDELAREAEAEEHRRLADALDPPPPPPPDEPLPFDTRGVLVVLLPAPDDDESGRVEGGWPEGDLGTYLGRRLRTRLPGAELAVIDPVSVTQARSWVEARQLRLVLSLRLERAYCSDSAKDGPFSVAWLRVAGSTPAGALGPPVTVRETVLWPRRPARCREMALARALERGLGVPALQEALALGSSDAPRSAWPSPALRRLFPGLGERIAARLEVGRGRLATGRLEEAEQAFRGAAGVDPDDLNVRAYLAEVELTLAMARELQHDREDASTRPAPGPQAEFDVLLTPAQRAAAETLLEEEKRLRDELLAVLALSGTGGDAPGEAAVAALRPVEIRDVWATGPRLARERAGGPVEARALFAPDGTPVARYYFAEGDVRPLLRESDTDGDDAPDYWTAWNGATRSDVWEDRTGTGIPSVHLRYSKEGSLVSVEIDADVDGRTERAFTYEDGRLASEQRDSDNDGRIDRTDHFDAEGRVRLREDDLDGDGKTDVRSHYENGALVRREILHPELFDQLP